MKERIKRFENNVLYKKSKTLALGKIPVKLVSLHLSLSLIFLIDAAFFSHLEIFFSTSVDLFYHVVVKHP